ncbi:MAG: DoxX family protein [Nitrososphaeraceae archaeon]
MSEYFLLFVPYLALVTRVWMGANMMIHGYPKLRNMKQTAEGTKQLGIPVGATYTATVLEFFGGLFLIIGLIVPIIGLFFAIFMIANVIMKKTRMNAAYIATTDRASYEIDITYLILSIILIVLGAGALSVDSVIGLG